jgi:hypothetical protein
VKALGGDYPVFALRSQHLMSVVPRPTALQEIARAFADEIQAIAPSGRLLIGGVGFGSVLAWCTAEELQTRARGKDIASLLVGDAPPAAFFAQEGAQFRFVKPASSSGGLLGRLFKKSGADDSGATRELRQLRERYGDGELRPGAWSVVAINCGATEPWRTLSSGNVSTITVGQIGQTITAALKK